MKARYLIRSLRRQPALCLLLLFASHLAAQGTNEGNPVPKAPYIAPLPERFQWTVAISYVDEQKKTSGTSNQAPVTLRRVDSTKTGIYKHDIETFQNGQKREHWFASKMSLESDGKNHVMVVDYRDFPFSAGDPQVAAGWDAFSWITLGKYKGYIEIEKVPCFHYVLNDNTEAWVNADTNLPCVYRFKDQIYRFYYGPRPADLQLPPEYEKAWKQYQTSRSRTEALLSSGDR